MRSTFAGTELDFRLKLTRRTKNNPPQEMGREGGGGSGDRVGKKNDGERERIKESEMDLER